MPAGAAQLAPRPPEPVFALARALARLAAAEDAAPPSPQPAAKAAR